MFGPSLWHGKTGTRPACLRAGATPRTFWAAESRKSGVAPARFGSFPIAGFPFREMSTSSRSKKLLVPQGEETGEERNAACIPCVLHRSVPFRLIHPSVESNFPISSWSSRDTVSTQTEASRESEASRKRKSPAGTSLTILISHKK
jgi:hypothetical protein